MITEKEEVGVVSFAFGVPPEIWANELIAKIAYQKALERDAWIYTQEEIDIETGEGLSVYRIYQRPGKPPPTLRIARGAARVARDLEADVLLVIAAMPHLPRALRDTKYAIGELGLTDQVEVRACYEEIGLYPYNLWFSPDSMQAHTRSKWIWKIREHLLMFLPFFLYKRIAS